jgi:hypothetical protein
MQPSVIQNMTVWNVQGEGVYVYPTDRVTLDHLIIRDNAWLLQYSGLSFVEGVIFNDYLASDFTLTNADIRGVNIGFDAPTVVQGTVTIQNSYFSNLIDINIVQGWSVSGGGSINPRYFVIQNDVFNANPGIAHTSIQMDYESGFFNSNLIQTTQVLVYNYNGVSGDNFQVYYLQQDPNFILPQSDPSIQQVGSPVAGLTNQQNWAQFGIAFAGAISPTTQTRTGILGFVRAF